MVVGVFRWQPTREHGSALARHAARLRDKGNYLSLSVGCGSRVGHFAGASVTCSRRMGQEGLQEQQESSTDQAGIGDVENRELEPVEVQKIPDTAENEPVIEIAERTAQDQAKRGAQEADGRGGRPRAP